MINDFGGHIFTLSHVTAELHTLINLYISGIRPGCYRYRVRVRELGSRIRYDVVCIECVSELGSIIRSGCCRYRVCEGTKQ